MQRKRETVGDALSVANLRFPLLLNFGLQIGSKAFG
jgi:hypothetical protein